MDNDTKLSSVLPELADACGDATIEQVTAMTALVDVATTMSRGDESVGGEEPLAPTFTLARCGHGGWHARMEVTTEGGERLARWEGHADAPWNAISQLAFCIATAGPMNQNFANCVEPGGAYDKAIKAGVAGKGLRPVDGDGILGLLMGVAALARR